MMQEHFKWGHDAKKALEEAKHSKKLAILFFHSNQCSGCKATIAKTLPDTKVARFIDKMLVPAMFEVSEPGTEELMKKFGVEWTPTFVIADGSGNEVYRWVGYLPPGDFCAQMVLAEGKGASKNKDWDRAVKCYEALVKKFPDSEVAPEALYYGGVAKYEKTHDVSHLARANKELKSQYPKSSWAKKASVWG
jgi:thioredoxin-related protein